MFYYNKFFIEVTKITFLIVLLVNQLQSGYAENGCPEGVTFRAVPATCNARITISTEPGVKDKDGICTFSCTITTSWGYVYNDYNQRCLSGVPYKDAGDGKVTVGSPCEETDETPITKLIRKKFNNTADCVSRENYKSRETACMNEQTELRDWLLKNPGIPTTVYCCDVDPSIQQAVSSVIESSPAF